MTTLNQLHQDVFLLRGNNLLNTRNEVLQRMDPYDLFCEVRTSEKLKIEICRLRQVKNLDKGLLIGLRHVCPTFVVLTTETISAYQKNLSKLLTLCSI